MKHAVKHQVLRIPLPFTFKVPASLLVLFWYQTAFFSTSMIQNIRSNRPLYTVSGFTRAAARASARLPRGSTLCGFD